MIFCFIFYSVLIQCVRGAATDHSMTSDIRSENCSFREYDVASVAVFLLISLSYLLLKLLQRLLCMFVCANGKGRDVRNSDITKCIELSDTRKHIKHNNTNDNCDQLLFAYVCDATLRC